eukprot:Partr_v1_DN28707_c2_g1_i2_m62444 putative Nuclear transcription factor, X-box binding 1
MEETHEKSKNRRVRRRKPRKPKEASDQPSTSTDPPLPPPLVVPLVPKEGQEVKANPKRSRHRNRNKAVDEVKKNQPRIRLTQRSLAVIPSSSGGSRPKESMDLRDRLIDSLSRADYECTICYDYVRRADETWACDRCHFIFHLPCIRKWAQQSNSVDDTPQDRSKQQMRWRCPGCQFKRLALPRQYMCFCGKVTSPVHDRQNHVTPHTCGAVCGRLLSPAVSASSPPATAGVVYRCPHRCSLPCHPGPCPSCEAMAPVDSCKCHCGSSVIRMQCSRLSQEYPLGRSCGGPCAKMLSCRRHWCVGACHAGPCGQCSQVRDIFCYCARKTSKQIPCASKESAFSCGQDCGFEFECGVHKCDFKCHPALSGHDTLCPKSPLRPLSCPCGKREAKLISTRLKCTDPLPSCGMICKLKSRKPCGHVVVCDRVCHDGPCLTSEALMECHSVSTVRCKCGSVSRQVQCGTKEYRNLMHELPEMKCQKLCRKMKSCGRHRCSELCCSGNHECELTCDLTLNCGLHKCTKTCHKGKCQPCRDLIFDEWRCACGNTIRYPPYTCGTAMPDCGFPCSRVRQCGHATNIISPHNCHEDNIACPPCMIFTTKKCVCGKETLNNIACSLAARCSNRCAKALACGNPEHKCSFGCHDGPCADCTNQCCRLRICGHPCPAACHGLTDCPAASAVPCPILVKVSCGCRVAQVTITCPGLSTPPPQLECTAECDRINRNKRMERALQIQESSHFQSNIPERLLIFIRQFPRVARLILNDLEMFISKYAVDEPFGVKRFAAMRSEYRQFIHMIVEDFGALVGLESEAVDREPNRSVVVRQTKSVSAIGKQSLLYFNDMIAKLLAATESRRSQIGEHGIQADSNENRLLETCIRDHSHLLASIPRRMGHMFDALSIAEAEGQIVEVKYCTGFKVMFRPETPLTLDLLKQAIDALVEDVNTSLEEEFNDLSASQCKCLCKGCTPFNWLLPRATGESEPPRIPLAKISLKKCQIVMEDGVDECTVSCDTTNAPEISPKIRDWIHWMIMDAVPSIIECVPILIIL